MYPPPVILCQLMAKSGFLSVGLLIILQGKGICHGCPGSQGTFHTGLFAFFQDDLCRIFKEIAKISFLIALTFFHVSYIHQKR